MSSKALHFARFIISAGVVGIFTPLLSIIANAQIDEAGIYISLITISTALLLSQDTDNINTTKEGFFNTLIISSAASLLIIVCGFLRELLGFGSLFGFDLYTKFISPIGFLTSSAGGLFTLAVLCAVYALIIGKDAK